MRISELRPTEENIRNTYLNDTIGRNKDVNAFIDILNTLENSCAIALDGVWGSGKTFFVQQVKMVLDACCRDSENADKQSVRRKWTTMHNGKEPEFQSQLCVYYDAWENDNDEDPVLSLVYSILQDVDAESPFEKESGIFDKGAAIAECLSGRSITAVVDSLKSKDKFIMVQLPEKTDEKSEAYKAGYQNICEIGKERIRRAGTKINNENEKLKDVPLIKDNKDVQLFLSIAENGHDAIEHTKSAFERVDISHSLDTGFRVLKCDTSNMKDVYYNPAEYEVNMFSRLEDNIKEDRTPEDLLFQVMLDLGVLLSSKIEETTIAGKKVFNVEDNYLIACFDSDVSEETIKAIAKQKPYYFVMRDSSMASDSVATNFDQIFATYSPDTVRKVL